MELKNVGNGCQEPHLREEMHRCTACSNTLTSITKNYGGKDGHKSYGLKNLKNVKGIAQFKYCAYLCNVELKTTTL